MKWLKIVWHFMLRHLPRWLHIAAHEIQKAHEDCPVCKDEYPCEDAEDIAPDNPDDNPYMDYHEYCRECDLFEDCKSRDDSWKGEE